MMCLSHVLLFVKFISLGENSRFSLLHIYPVWRLSTAHSAGSIWVDCDTQQCEHVCTSPPAHMQYFLQAAYLGMELLDCRG